MKNTLSDLVYEKIYQKIVTGQLKPGEKLTEMGLANSEGTSRSPVREALKRLSEDRLVTLVARSRCYVRKLTIAEVDILFEIRSRLECLALEYAFDHFDRAKLLNLKQSLQECSNMSDPENIQKARKLDLQLHALIRETSGSADLTHLLNNISARVNMFRLQAYSEIVPFPLNTTPATHIHIIDAILEGSREDSLRLLQAHIDNNRRHVVDHMRDLEASREP
ncbi:MAG: GntR family transcriptional regulator [Planctomycetes bacterium]|nr:GntR family transcriptional regulator [Planctomycetota bacterium]